MIDPLFASKPQLFTTEAKEKAVTPVTTRSNRTKL